MKTKSIMLEKRKTVLDEKMLELNRTINKRANEQCCLLRIEAKTEAQKIVELSGLRDKERHPSFFVDTAMLLLCYPPEAAYSIAIHLTDFTRRTPGFNPYGMTMVAVTKMDSLSQ